jgi:hypothetical protein
MSASSSSSSAAPKSVRRILSILTNLSSSTSCSLLAKELAHMSNREAFAKSNKAIREHAEMRIQDYFIKLVAYHQTDRVPQLSFTAEQHGKGEKLAKGVSTQAAHRSFLPNLSEVGREALLDNTAFGLESAGAVDILPDFVNRLDDQMEKALREPALKILQNVAAKASKGSMGVSLHDGFHQFLKEVNKTLERLLRSASDKTKDPDFDPEKEVKVQLIQAYQDAMFRYEMPDGKVSNVCDDNAFRVYFETLLGLSAEAKILCDQDPIKLAEEIYQQRTSEIQTEILS